MAEPPGEEADEEPKLKYVRLGASVFDILQKDSATCMAVHEKFLALGTNWGVVYILDVTGNEIKRFAAHSACVNELCIEDTGECTINALRNSHMPFYSYVYIHNCPQPLLYCSVPRHSIYRNFPLA